MATKTARKGTGLIHIYCGDGKGKTTTGMGLCLRAAGYGYRVLIYQFMKDNSTSERRALAAVEGITMLEGLAEEKFSFQLSSQERRERREFYNSQFRKVTGLAAEQEFDVLFLDEAVYAIRAGLLDEELVADFLEHKPDKLEVILTGQEPGERLVELADYVSEIRKIKHPFDRKQPARDGIER